MLLGSPFFNLKSSCAFTALGIPLSGPGLQLELNERRLTPQAEG